MKNYTMAVNGRHFDFLDMETNVADISEIARALSRITRYNGHYRNDVGFYSVAQHSVLVSMRVPLQMRKAALLHDAAEAYLFDAVSPVKPLLPDYCKLYARVEQWVEQSFNINVKTPEIKKADLEMLAAEKRDLLYPDAELWSVLDGIEPATAKVNWLYPPDAYDLFMREWCIVN